MTFSCKDIDKIENDPIFLNHDCRIVSNAEYRSFDIVRKLEYRKIRPDMGHSYIKPPDGFISHFIWGGSYSHRNYQFEGIMFERLIEDVFNKNTKRKYIAGIRPEPELILECGIFSFVLFSNFLNWAGYIQEAIVIDPTKRIIFYREEEFEYCLYSRDPKINIDPFPGVSDQYIVKKFQEGEEYFKSDFGNTKKRHIKEDILPFCLEGSEI